MTSMKGFGLIGIIIAIAFIVAVGGGAYVSVHPEVLANIQKEMATTADDGVQTAPGDHPEVDHEANELAPFAAIFTGDAVHWKLDEKAEINGIPQTLVSVQIGIGAPVYEIGTFQGSCTQVGASGGVDGKGLLAGELSAVQCYYAGGGNEIGVFAHEDGGAQVMVGDLDEGSAESASVRGNFKITDLGL